MSVVNIEFRANANFTELIAEVNRANAALAAFQKNAAASNVDGAYRAMAAARDSLTNSGKFHAYTTQVISDTQKFGDALNRQKLSLADSYRANMDYLRKRDGIINRFARQQAALEKSMVISHGRTAGGGLGATVIAPQELDAFKDKALVASKAAHTFNKNLSMMGTGLINWGKNTQWAGRQLMVGLTIPLTIFGALAAKTFLEADKQLVRLVKVYGDTATNLTAQQTQALRESTMALSKELASAWGVSMTETIGLAADLAAVGKQGDDLMNSTRETTRLMVLGEVDRQTAMKTTLSLQSAFKQNNQELTESINFLNAVENQTSASLQDLTTVIPKAGPVVRGLGGDVKDLALMFVAMKEGGVPASEAANAIKSSLASLINPTKKTTEFFKDLNIDITRIIENNQGKLVPTLFAVKKALDGLDPLNRSRAIEMMFGKFQFARISALFDNLGRAGSQTNQVINLMGASTQQLANVAKRELNAVTESASGKFQRAVESIKASMAQVGEAILPVGTFLLNLADKFLTAFNAMPDGFKTALGVVAGFGALVGPVIMITGVMGNFLGYLVKGVGMLRHVAATGRGSFEYLTPELLAAKKLTDQLEIGFTKNSTAIKEMAAAVDVLIAKLLELQTTKTGVSAPLAQSNAAGRAAAAGVAISALGAGRPVTGMERVLAEHSVVAGSLIPSGGKEAAIQRSLNKNAMIMSVVDFDDTGKTQAQADAWRKQHLLDQTTHAETRRDISGLNSQQLRMLAPSRQDFQAINLRYLAIVEQAKAALATASTDAVKDWNRAKIQIAEAAKSGNWALAVERLEAAARELGVTEEKILAQTASDMKMVTARVNAAGTGGAARKAAFSQVIAELVAREGAATGLGSGGPTMFTGIGSGSRRGGSGVSTRGFNAMYLAEMQRRVMETGTMGISPRGRIEITGTELAHYAPYTQIKSQLEQAGAEVQAVGQSASRVLPVLEKFRINMGAGAALVASSTAATKALPAATTTYRIGLSQHAAAQLQAASATAMIPPAIKTELTATGRSAEAINATVVAERELASETRRLASKRGQVAAVTNPSTANTAAVAAEESKRSGLRSAKAMGAVGALSMIPFLLPDTGNASAETAKNVLGGAGMGAMVGMMGGAPGMIAGGIIGAAIPAVQKLIDKMNEAGERARAMASTGEAAAGMFGASIKTLSDVSLQGLVDKSKEAKSAIDQVAESLTNAADGTSDKSFVDALKEAADGSEIQGFIRDRAAVLSMSGVSAKDIGVYIAGALKAAGKESYALDIKAYIDKFELSKGPEKIIQDKINDAVGKAQGTLLELGDLQKQLDEGLISQSYFDGHKASLREQYINNISEAVKTLSDAASTMPIEKFLAMLDGLDLSRMDPGAATESLLRLTDGSDQAKNALQQLANSGATTKEQLIGISLVNAGVISSWNELAALPPVQLVATYQIRGANSDFLKGMTSLPPAMAAASEDAKDTQDAIDAMREAAQDRQDRFSAQKEKIKDYYDAEIDKLKEREDARQKAFDREKKIADRQKQLRDMQIGYREALASGNFGQAALIRNNMENQQKQWKIEDSAEAAKDATDKKIKILEKERDAKIKAIEAAAKADKKASDAAIKAAEKASKAGISAAQREQLARTKALNTYAADSARILNDVTLTQGEKMQALALAAKRVGVALPDVLLGPLQKQFGRRDGLNVYKVMANNLEDGPWNQLAAMIAAKARGDTTIATQLLRSILNWGNANADVTTAPDPGKIGGGVSDSNPNQGGFYRGGLAGRVVRGLGTETSDSIPARLSLGEFVMKAQAVKDYGPAFMHAVNEGRFATGGLVGAVGKNFARAAVMGVASWVVNKARVAPRPVATTPAPGTGPAPAGSSRGVAPVGTRYVTNGLYYNRGGPHAEGWRGMSNSGVNDISAETGTPFKALMGGTVEHAAQGYYYPPGYIIVRSPDGTRIRYAHARVAVEPGQRVSAGQVVGYAATTNEIPISGRSMTSPHLHFAWKGNRKLIQREHGYVPWLDNNGNMMKFARGGHVSAELLTGETVMNRAASARYGGMLQAMNNQRYHTGGLVTPTGPRRDKFASMGEASYTNNITVNIDASARPDLDEKALAKYVINEIKQKESRKGGKRR